MSRAEYRSAGFAAHKAAVRQRTAKARHGQQTRDVGFLHVNDDTAIVDNGQVVLLGREATRINAAVARAANPNFPVVNHRRTVVNVHGMRENALLAFGVVRVAVYDNPAVVDKAGLISAQHAPEHEEHVFLAGTLPNAFLAVWQVLHVAGSRHLGAVAPEQFAHVHADFAVIR